MAKKMPQGEKKNSKNWFGASIDYVRLFLPFFNPPPSHPCIALSCFEKKNLKCYVTNPLLFSVKRRKIIIEKKLKLKPQ